MPQHLSHPHPSLPAPSVPNNDDQCTGYLYFWAHIQAKWIYDLIRGIDRPEPTPTLDWWSADQLLRDEYKDLEDTFRCHPIIQAMLHSKNSQGEGQDQIDNLNCAEVAACGLFENLHWEQVKSTAQSRGGAHQLELTEEKEAWVKAVARNQWVSLPPNHRGKVAFVKRAKTLAEPKASVLIEQATFDLKSELDYIDDLELYPTSVDH